MLKDSITIKGDLRILVQDSVSGCLKEDKFVHNLVVTTGKNLIASRLSSNSDSVITHMAIGTNGTTAQSSDATLVAELVRQAVTTPGGVVTANTVKFECVYAAGVGTGSIQEAGLFNANSSGMMLARTTFPVINKGASDIMTIYWTITIG